MVPHHDRLRAQIAIERAAPSVPHLPRLRALQVCRRRPTLGVATSVTAGIRKPLHLPRSDSGLATVNVTLFSDVPGCRLAWGKSAMFGLMHRSKLGVISAMTSMGGKVASSALQAVHIGEHRSLGGTRQMWPGLSSGERGHALNGPGRPRVDRGRAHGDERCRPCHLRRSPHSHGRTTVTRSSSFANTSGDREHDYFADVITDNIITK